MNIIKNVAVSSPPFAQYPKGTTLSTWLRPEHSYLLKKTVKYGL